MDELFMSEIKQPVSYRLVSFNQLPVSKSKFFQFSSNIVIVSIAIVVNELVEVFIERKIDMIDIIGLIPTLSF